MADGSAGQVLDAPRAAPTVGWALGPLGAAQAADREIARQTALRARAVAAFAATRPATTDRAQGERGAMSAQRWAARAEVLRPVSEWATQELAVALDLTTQAAEAELVRSLTLVQRLPAVLDALEAGALHAGHLWCLLEHVAPIPDDVLRARVQAEVLAWLAARSRVTTAAQLGERVRRTVARLHAPDAARDLTRALRERGVSVRPERTAGMSAVTVVCSTPEAQALVRALAAYVDALDADPADTRTRGQKTVDCLLDLVLRPGESSLPPVQVLLTVVASVQTLLGGDTPGEVDGQVVPAEMARQLARAFAGLAPASPDATDAAGQADSIEPAATGEPEDAYGGPVERAAESLNAEDFDRWLDDLVRDAFGDDPPPDPSPLEPDPHSPVSDVGWDTGPDDLHDPQRPRTPADGDLPGGEPPAGGQGWWAAADRAVDDAGDPLLVLERALGHAHRMVRTAQTADAADETAWRTGPAGHITAARDALSALAAAGEAQRAELAALLAATAGGGLADRPRLALTDAVTGALRTLTDLPALRRAGTCGQPACTRTPDACDHDLAGRPGLGAPGPTDGYRPTAGLDRWVRARDRCCRFPGCRRRIPRAGELDHVRPWPDGKTSAANLAGFCTTHHRGKHQAPGWTHTLRPDGTLTVTTPTGLTAVTEPPPY
ncbi:HNH endonuclease signature motif containing protein [Geodermatophilus tzadiensis]|uniref:HNH endonuclease signature motif containing protein n=1 Tax=Geodermatophilus tzadiensis TaxID=1137988 RepID=UPI001FE841F6|nr:HNH endonuclease signature motif containing protein [Geodermatophilus tzadiensis]